MNTMFPGRNNYTGPTAGMFGLLHHKILCEDSHDVMERVRYVRHEKEAHEIDTRLHNMIFLGFCPAAAPMGVLQAEAKAKHNQAWKTYRIAQEDVHKAFADQREAFYAHRPHNLLDEDQQLKIEMTHFEQNRAAAQVSIDYTAVSKALREEHEMATAPYVAVIEAYIREHIPDTAWNGKTLVFPPLLETVS